MGSCQRCVPVILLLGLVSSGCANESHMAEPAAPAGQEHLEIELDRPAVDQHIRQESPLPRFSGLGAGEALRIEVFSVFPNTLILVEPDNQQVIVLRPQSPGVTHETFANYLVSDASQTGDLAKMRDEYYRSAIEINDQDAALLASLQSTRSMDVGGETQLTQAWDQTVQRFQRIWARKLLTGLGQ